MLLCGASPAEYPPRLGAHPRAEPRPRQLPELLAVDALRGDEQLLHLLQLGRGQRRAQDVIRLAREDPPLRRTAVLAA